MDINSDVVAIAILAAAVFAAIAMAWDLERARMGETRRRIGAGALEKILGIGGVAAKEVAQ